MKSTNISEKTWEESYAPLHALARRLVRQMGVSHWSGQEEDVAWDIVQESMRRAFEYAQKTEQNTEAKPIQSLTALLNTVAQNYSRDLRRREWRLYKETASNAYGFVDTETNFSEIATENAYCEHLFREIASEIALFPTKQRQALLRDLAGRMVFEEKPSALQAAFQAYGIHLEEYRTPRSECELERSRNAALLAHAYKRLKQLKKVQAYLVGA